MAKDRRRQPGAAELLGDWRAAERDSVAAKAAQTVADRALTAANAAETAATESQAAARAAVDAAKRAHHAADEARKVAALLSEGVATDVASALDAKTQANHALAEAESAETHARDRYHQGEAKGFRDET